MPHVVLVEPEIAPNAGNVARLCAAMNCPLHFVGRLGFRLDDKTLKRAALDYWPHVDWHRHDTVDDFLKSTTVGTIYLVDNPAPKSYTQTQFEPDDVLMFGSESAGLSPALKRRFPLIEIPMPNPNVRSLNLATSVGIVLGEALRQIGSRSQK
jgi:tRNA (cytidine/uridine-2'-O-)-methyltransferase